VPVNRLAVNCGDSVIEYSLDSRAIIQSTIYNDTILALIYTNSALLLATDNATIIVQGDEGAEIKQIQSSLGNIVLFSKHNHDEWRSRPEEVIAVTEEVNSVAYLLHIDVANGIDST
jgi:hypothetical protein